MECPRCRCVSLESETVCECGFNFITGAGGKPPLRQVARNPALWRRLAAWPVGLGLLFGVAGLFGGAWFTCTFLYPGTHEADVCGYTGMGLGILGALTGAVVGGAIAVRKTTMNK
jgi:hypothetical protein